VGSESTLTPLGSYLSRSSSNPPTRSNRPPSARGSSLGGFRISSFVNPGVTVPAVARAVHQDAVEDRRGLAPGGVLPGGVRLDLVAAGRSSLTPLGGRPRRSSTASWWTARATAGTVTPGFTKEEILKPPKEDPRAEGGLFDRVGGLLGELLR